MKFNFLFEHIIYLGISGFDLVSCKVKHLFLHGHFILFFFTKNNCVQKKKPSDKKVLTGLCPVNFVKALCQFFFHKNAVPISDFMVKRKKKLLSLYKYTEVLTFVIRLIRFVHVYII